MGRGTIVISFLGFVLWGFFFFFFFLWHWGLSLLRLFFDKLLWGCLLDSKLLEKTLPCTANVQAITMLISQRENKTNKKKMSASFVCFLEISFLMFLMLLLNSKNE